MRYFMTLLGLLLVTTPALAQVTFTGDVDTDFAEIQNCFEDQGGQDVGLPVGVSGTGLDLEKVCFYYDGNTDILYVGAAAVNDEIFGDADGDGNAGSSSSVGIADFADLDSTETFAISLDLDGNSEGAEFDANTVDVLIGVSDSDSLNELGVFLPADDFDPFDPGSGFGVRVLLTADVFASPSATDRDLEFSIQDFSTLNVYTETFAAVPYVQVFMGSTAAAGIGSDYLPASGESVAYSIYDGDEDGLQDWIEIEMGTDPSQADTDDDGVNDGDEVNGENPTDPLATDSDSDGLLDGEEDTNGNGQVDTGETNPNRNDSDGDGLTDGTEVNGVNPTDPLDGDTDGDGLRDNEEDINLNGQIDNGETDPNNPDSDGGGVNDGAEEAAGLDPTDPGDDAQAGPTTATGVPLGYNAVQGGGVGCTLTMHSNEAQKAPLSLMAVTLLILWKVRRRKA